MPKDQGQPLVVRQLTVENFKRISAVSITPKGDVVYLNGDNDQGKSSTVEAMLACLLGKIAIPKEPVRKGQKKAVVRVDLGEFTVERAISPDGKHSLRILSADPNVQQTQATLNAMIGQLAFDPFEFAHLPGKEQAARLREAAGIDTTQIDRERAELYEERTAVGRVVARLEGAIAQNPQTGPILEHVDTRPLLDDLEVLQEQIAALNRKIRETEEHNRKVQNQAGRRIDQQNLDAERKSREEITEEIGALDARKAKMLADAKMPVAGLELQDDAVLYQGVPLEQAGDATRLEVATALGFALNPKIRVAFIRQGSLLDENALARMAAMAAEHEGQVWIERVGTDGPVGFVIEDGKVAEEVGS